MLVLALSTTFTNRVKASSADGWYNIGYPQYSKPSGTRNQWGDISGDENIMNRIRSSYSYKNRMTTIQSRTWGQACLYPQTANPYSDYTNISYCNSPYGAGYTEWYDSVFGVFLDYEAGILNGSWSGNGDQYCPTSVTQDSIDFNNVQFGNTSTAYIATRSYDQQLGDAKEAAIVARNNGSMLYPIYLNNGGTIENGIQSAAISKGIKNLIVLGGSVVFPTTAGLNTNFSIIRVGGLNRDYTGTYLANLPNQVQNEGANHWTGDSNGIVMLGVPSAYQSTVYSYLQQQASQPGNVTNLVNAVNYLTTYATIGAAPYASETPYAVIGVHNNYMETYWICYFSTTGGLYTYQYILPNYFNRNCNIEFLDSNHNPISSVSMLQGQTWNGYVRAHNTGNVTWDENPDHFRLGTDGTSFPSQPGRYYLSQNVSANNYYDFPITLNGTNVGSFNLHYQMLQEGVQWFGNSLNIPVTVNPWANPNTQYGGVWQDTGSGPGQSVYTSVDGSKWVKPNQSFYVSAVGYSPWSSEQINEAHLQIYNKSNSSDQQIIKSSGMTYTPWGYSYWQDSAPNNSVHFLSGYGFARRNSSWNIDGNGQYVESYFKMSLSNNNTDYWQGSRMVCLPYGYQYWSNGANFDYYNTIKTDGDPPISDNLITTIQGVNTVQLTLKNCRDLRSGLNDSTVRVAVWHDGDSYRDWYTMTRVSGTNDFSVTVDLTLNDHIGKYGTFDAQAYAADNLGNDGMIYSTTFVRPNPSPINGKLAVTQYDYFDNASTYWVKPQSTFGIYTEGYFPTLYGIYPDRTYVLFAKDGTMTGNSGRQYADINTKGTSGSEFNTYFTFISDGDKATRYQANSNNYISHTHHLKANTDGTAFKLYYTNSYFVGATENYPPYQDSGLWLKVDGKAPTGNCILNYDSTSLKIDITVKNASDNGGSGVKKLWVKYYPTNVTDDSKKQTMDLSLVNGDWVGTINPYDVYSSDDVKVEIWAVDNVGNSAELSENIYDLFTVKAYVVPYNNPTFTGTPSLLQGQKAILRIITTGGPDKLQVTFPDDLSKLDSTLNTTFGIVPQKYLVTEIPFNVPLYAPFNSYTVNVKAFKSLTNTTKESNPQFNVNGSILDGLRTRRRDKDD